MPYLSREQHDRFNQDGFLVVPDFLAISEVERVERGITEVLDRRCRDLERDCGGFNLEKVDDDSFNPHAPAKRPGMMRKIQGGIFEVPALHEVFAGDRLLDCMQDLMGQAVYYHSSKVFFKAAGGGSPKPWHQDAAYWQQYDPRQLTAWIAIHDADQGNGCVWAIPGSHRLGLMSHRERELQIPLARIPVDQARAVPVARGGLLIFHSLVLHMSQSNRSERDRWAIICDYDCQPNPCLDHPGGARPPGMDAHGIWQLRGSPSLVSGDPRAEAAPR